MLGYLDYAATTPMRPEAVEAMLPFLSDQFANPSGAHRLARDARRSLDAARATLADLLGAEPGEVVFTSGGTESDNLAVLGPLDRRGGVAVCSAVEHHAVLDAVVERGGRLVQVDARGVVSLDALADAIGPDTAVVSVMLANNEVGTVQPLADVVQIVRERAPDALVHTDAVQAFSWIDVASVAAEADLISISAHKFGGPKGAGVLVVRPRAHLSARQLGGGQERGLRSGTHNVAAAVAMATAAQLTVARRTELASTVGALRDRLAEGLTRAVSGLHVTAGDAPRTPGICHVCIEGVESEELLFLLEKKGVYASAASSCSSGAQRASHVLDAMGVEPALARGSLRLSLGFASTPDDVDLALEVIPPAVERLRAFSASVSSP